MGLPLDDTIGATRAHIARIERRVGSLAAGCGALALLGFAVFRGDEHRLVVLALFGLPALLGGGLLFVAGRLLARPGPRAIAGQLLPILFAAYWALVLN